MVVAAERVRREEIARRGDEIHGKSISPILRAEDAGCYAVIDVSTGELMATDCNSAHNALAHTPF